MSQKEFEMFLFLLDYKYAYTDNGIVYYYTHNTLPNIRIDTYYTKRAGFFLICFMHPSIHAANKKVPTYKVMQEYIIKTIKEINDGRERAKKRERKKTN